VSTPEADLLKVAADADLSEIKRAYRKAALAHHPDQNPHPDASRHFRRITEAYRVLEARALEKHPQGPRARPLDQRVTLLLDDVRTLVRKGPDDRWSRIVDGLPEGVWVISVLDVLARNWPRAPAPSSAPPTADGISVLLAAWDQRRALFPLLPLTPREEKSLKAALQSAEVRLAALVRAPLKGRV
jgi:DnaJ domain